MMMTKESGKTADGLHMSPDSDLKLWTVTKIDIRSPVMPSAWPVARLELSHPKRGRVTDIGTAPGAFDAAFVAAGQILSISPELLAYNVVSYDVDEEKALKIKVDIKLRLNGKEMVGTSTGVDLVRCSLDAWLDAASHMLP